MMNRLFFALWIFSIPLYSNVILSLTEPIGVARVNEPVTSGVPLAKSDNVLTTENMGLFLNGVEVPCQFVVTSRWNGLVSDAAKPIRWVLLDFNADVPANGTAQYEFRPQGGSGNASGTLLSHEETSSELTVHTGKIDLVFNKDRFNFLSRVTDGTHTWVNAGSGAGGADITMPDNTVFKSVFDQPDSVTVEQEGPKRLVVKVKGSFRSSDNGTLLNPDGGRGWVNYTLRLYAYDNQDFVRMFFTLENNGEGAWHTGVISQSTAQNLVFDNLKLKMATSFSGNRTVVTEKGSAAYASNETFSLRQDHKIVNYYKESSNLKYRISKNGIPVDSGSRSAGWAEVNNGSLGMMVGVRHFWQNYPLAISEGNGALSLDFLPTFTNEYTFWETNDYFFRGGLYKTWECMMRFYTGAADPAVTARVTAGLNEPLFALAPARYYINTRAWGMIGAAGQTSLDPDQNEAFQRFEQLQVVKIDSTAGTTTNACGLQWAAERRAVQYGGEADWYSWKNYGDIPWADGYSGGHYDWNHSLLLHYLRTGNRKFFDMGVAMVKHRYDIDQTHDFNGHSRATKFLEVYEKDDHGTNRSCPDCVQIPVPSHTWSEGVWLYYLLTGDLQARLAGELTATAMLQLWGPGGYNGDVVNGQILPPDDQVEIRHQSWSIVNLLAAYRVTGKPEYLAVANGLCMNSILPLEQKYGGFGCINADTTSTEVLMATYASYGLIRLHDETGDPAVLALLQRMWAWLPHHRHMGGGVMEGGLYWPLWVRSFVKDNNPSTETYINCNFGYFWADAGAYIYKNTGDTAALRIARRMFRDGTFYWEWAAEAATDGGIKDTRIDPASRNPIRLISGMWAYTASKNHGYIGKGMEVYLFVEDSLSGGGTGTQQTSLEKEAEPAVDISPNPFNPETRFVFNLASTQNVKVMIYSISGKLVEQIINDKLQPGCHRLTWSPKAKGASSVYLAKIAIGKKSLYRKIVMIK
ncbi:MAG: T9SS type A sorting domain-containing protein [Fibrobacterota bacterium]